MIDKARNTKNMTFSFAGIIFSRCKSEFKKQTLIHLQILRRTRCEYNQVSCYHPRLKLHHVMPPYLFENNEHDHKGSLYKDSKPCEDSLGGAISPPNRPHLNCL